MVEVNDIEKMLAQAPEVLGPPYATYLGGDTPGEIVTVEGVFGPVYQIRFFDGETINVPRKYLRTLSVDPRDCQLKYGNSVVYGAEEWIVLDHEGNWVAIKKPKALAPYQVLKRKDVRLLRIGNTEQL